MANVIFNYNGIDTLIQCNIRDKLRDICEKFCIKSQISLDKLIFMYGGGIINLDLKFNEVANQIDRQSSKMNILVVENSESNMLNEKDRIVRSKDIICPKCGEICLINFKDYKIILNNCKNKHESLIMLNEYDNTQNINENKIICDICKKNNKSKSYKNKFYVCGTCNKKLCLLCKENHGKEHSIIDYENKNYLCHRHNEPFSSYCKICRENLCVPCQIEHNNKHEIILYAEIAPNINNIKNTLKELKDIIDRFSNNIDDIIDLFKNIKVNIELYYTTNNEILNNYNIKKRSYETFSNLNSVRNTSNNTTPKDLNDIINEKDIKTKFSKIYNLNDKIKNKTDNLKNLNKEMIKDDKDGEEKKKVTIEFKNKELTLEIKKEKSKFFEIPDIEIENVGNQTYRQLFFVKDELNSSKDIHFLSNSKNINIHTLSLAGSFEPYDKGRHSITLRIDNPKSNQTYRLFIYVKEDPKKKNLSESLKINIKIKGEEVDQQKRMENYSELLYKDFASKYNLLVICTKEEGIKKIRELNNDKSAIEDWIKKRFEEKLEKLVCEFDDEYNILTIIYEGKLKEEIIKLNYDESRIREYIEKKLNE